LTQPKHRAKRKSNAELSTDQDGLTLAKAIHGCKTAPNSSSHAFFAWLHAWFLCGPEDCQTSPANTPDPQVIQRFAIWSFERGRLALPLLVEE
jgi:hypothetical protein